MKAYKLFTHRKNGTIGSLFINKRQVIPIGEWVTAESHKTKGFAYRPGWHGLLKPEAPHMSTSGRIWMRVELDGTKLYKRPDRQGGAWVLAERMRVIGPVETSDIF